MAVPNPNNNGVIPQTPSNLPQAKTLGGIGSILPLISLPFAFFGSFGLILSLLIDIVGLILVLIAVKYISDEAKDARIFNNYLYAVIIGIVGTVIAIVIAFILFLTLFVNFLHFVTVGIFTIPLSASIILLVIPLIIIYFISIIQAIFIRRSFNDIARVAGVPLFSTTALLILIGAILIIVLVGFIILFIASILQIVSFFSLPDRLPQKHTGDPSQV